jgi:protein-disulfide isomerase
MVRSMPQHWMTPPGFQRTWTTLALCLALSSPPVSAQSVGGQPIPAQGPAGALIEIVEIGDFECPYCAKAQAALKQVMEAYPTLVRRVFIHQPLPFHDQALQTALASVVAQQQGKFWRVADTFFVEQGDLSTRHTRQVALRNNIEVAALTEGLKSPEAQAFVEANKQVALALGVSGTPVFFVNGTMIRGAKPFSSFKKIIDIEIALAGKAPMTPERAAAHRQARTKTNNADLHAYLYGGKAAPKADEATRSRSGGTAGADDEPRYKATIRVDDPFRGDREKALVTVVSFVGYQCKYSRGMMGALSDIQAQLGEEVGLVLKHLPLSIHPLGAEAAVTALCAHQQGKFWEVNEALFSDSQISAAAVLSKAQSKGWIWSP